MKPSKQHYQAYANATQTVAKTRQIVMLYDGAIRSLRQAADAIDERRVEDRFHLLVKASDIISGLQGCLDFENGGSMATLLYNFYSQVELKIFAIHRNASRAACEQVVEELKSMRDAWAEIDQNTSAEGESPAAPSGNVMPASVTTVSSETPESFSANGGVTLSA